MTAPDRATPGGVGWPDLLDALEERNRRCGAALRGAGPMPAEVPLRPDGPLPADLRLRAQVVLEQTARLEQLAARRAEHARLAAHYST